MIGSLTACVLTVFPAVVQQPQASISDRASLDRFIYPTAPFRKAPKVVTDSSDMPEAAPWLDAAKSTVQQWFSPICQLLASQKYMAPKQIKLVVKKTLEAPAYTVGDTITVDGAWISTHPNDLGMIVHELTHVIQAYPDGPKPGWLVEGIADYVRWWRYEPSPQVPRFGPNATYHDSYRTTAAFLAWVSEHFDQRIVPALDLAMRNGQDPEPLFKQLTGHTEQELWDDMIAHTTRR